MTTNETNTTAAVPPITRLTAQACYGLFSLGTLIPPLLAVALLLNLARRERAKDTWLASRFSRQTRDFWKFLGVLFVVMPIMMMLDGAQAVHQIGEGADIARANSSVFTDTLKVYLACSGIFAVRMVLGWRSLRCNTAA